MADIFISYKREEQPVARKLADALEALGWSVWWDPKLRAGEHFDDVIEAALKEANCILVLWSKLSVKSRYVKDEASYALRRKKLVPIAIEEADPPFRFEGLHTGQLLDWDAMASTQEFQKLVSDIEGVVGPPPTAATKVAKLAQKKRPTKKPSVGPRGTLEPGTIFWDNLTDGSEGPEMVVLPNGEFMMGSPDSDEDASDIEKPQHRITISQPFAVGKYEVTFDEWDICVADGGCDGYRPDDQRWGRGRRPVINVSWDDAKAYVAWLSQETGKAYRLLSEAEWEYAARAGTKTLYSIGDEISEKDANFGHKEHTTLEVGSYLANPWKLHDMHGNVWEWVEDCWNERYTGAPADGSARTWGLCSERVLRGGCWGLNSRSLRSATRNTNLTGRRKDGNGFRVARTLP